MTTVISKAGNFLSSSKTAGAIESIGGLISGVGQLFNAQQDADVGDFNAEVLNQKAQAERQSQILLEQQKRRSFRATISSQLAFAGSSGFGLSGSPLDIMADSLTNAEMDIAIDKYNSEIRARGLQNEAQIVRDEGRRKSTVGFARAGTTFLSTAVDLLGR